MSDEPTPSELERIIEHNHRETSADILDLKSQLATNAHMFASTFDKYVLLAVYTVEIAALKEKVGELSTELGKARDASRNAVRGSIGAVIATVLGAIILGALKGMGH